MYSTHVCKLALCFGTPLILSQTVYNSALAFTSLIEPKYLPDGKTDGFVRSFLGMCPSLGIYNYCLICGMWEIFSELLFFNIFHSTSIH